MTLQYRPAVIADVADIVALVQSAYRGEASRAGWTTEADFLDGQRTDADEVSALVNVAGQAVLLAVDTDRIVGCCHVKAQAGGRCYFGMFAIDPPRQGQGVGDALFRQAEAWARDMAATEMAMQVIDIRDSLIAYYERRGYRRTGQKIPFPYGNSRFGLPRVSDLRFELLTKAL